eukprot:357202-Chlamydomonas_euryale.AAC.15
MASPMPGERVTSPGSAGRGRRGGVGGVRSGEGVRYEDVGGSACKPPNQWSGRQQPNAFVLPFPPCRLHGCHLPLFLDKLREV